MDIELCYGAGSSPLFGWRRWQRARPRQHRQIQVRTVGKRRDGAIDPPVMHRKSNDCYGRGHEHDLVVHCLLWQRRSCRHGDGWSS